MGGFLPQEVMGLAMPSISQPAFGQRLRHLRLERGIKQTELAGGPVSASYISRLEMGNRLPSRQALSYLADALGLSVEALLDGPGSQAANSSALNSPAPGGPNTGSGATGGGSATGTGAHAPGLDPPADPAAARNLLVQATMALHDGDTQRVLDLLEPALDLLDSVSPEWRWLVLWTLSETYGRRQQHPARAAVLRQLVEATAAWEGSAAIQSTLLAQLSADERALGNLASALEAGGQAVVVARAAGEPEQARALMAVAAAETEAGAVAKASERVTELLRIADRVAPRIAAHIYWTCAGVRMRQGRAEECDRLLVKALDTMESRDDPLDWARLRMAAGALRLRSGRTDDVRGWIEEARGAMELVGGPGQMAALLSLTAWLLWSEHSYQDALVTAEQAEDTGLLTFHDRLRTQLLRSRCLLELGRQAEALTLIRSTATRAEDAGYLDLATEGWKSLASALDSTRVADGV